MRLHDCIVPVQSPRGGLGLRPRGCGGVDGVTSPSPIDIVREFLLTVRSGADPSRASEFMAETVHAHQVTSNQPSIVVRTPTDYAAHVGDMLEAYGPFDFAVDELLADGDKVYARWTQRGRHLVEIDGYAPTGAPLVEVASCVYRVEDGRIAEYWIQIDVGGLHAQLRASAESR